MVGPVGTPRDRNSSGTPEQWYVIKGVAREQRQLIAEVIRRRRLACAVLFDIDGDFFHRWLAPAAMPQ